MNGSLRSSVGWRLAAVVTLAALHPPAATAQVPADSVRLELRRLTQLVDSLMQEVDRMRTEGREREADDALADLRAAAAAAAAAGAGGGPPAPAAEQEFVGRQRSLQALNPEISVNADVMAHLNPDDPDAQNFFPREFEFSFVSTLDPFSRAAIFVSRHGAGPEVVPFAGLTPGGEEHEEGFEVEEGYVEWVSLPGGLGLKVGRFQQQLTALNRWHSHALAFQSRSLPHLALVGEEALTQTGASLSWLTPFGGGGAGTYVVTIEATRSENEALWGEASSPSYLGHANGFWQLSRAVDFELGGAWLTGHFVDDNGSFGRDLYTAEMAFNWLPPARSRNTGLNVRAGVMRLVGLGDAAAAGRRSAGGFWSQAELRLSTTWLAGARFDRVSSPAAPDVEQWLFSPTLTWWQSEFVRLRGEYDFTSGIAGGDGSGMFILQATFAMGPHKHATY